MTAVWIVVAVLVAVAVAAAASYNRFVRQVNLVQESWRQVDVELRRRHELIPNLVEVVRGYAAHERAVLDGVVAARGAALRAAGDPAAQAAAEQELGRSLAGLFAVAENYPQLRSSENFLDLQRQLTETEDRIAAARRFYNGNVRALNTRVDTFPSGLVASGMHLRKAEYFEVDDPAVRAPVAVDLRGLGELPGR